MPGLQEPEQLGPELVVTLVNSDGVEFSVREDVALVSPTIEQLVGEQLVGERRVSLPSIQSDILSKVIEFVEKVVDSPAGVDLSWAKELVRVAPSSLTCLIMAADNLGIDGLLHVACVHAAELMAGKTPEEVQKLFGLKCDLTPEEEAETRQKNKWAFE